jgi:hypothetical protein
MPGEMEIFEHLPAGAEDEADEPPGQGVATGLAAFKGLVYDHSKGGLMHQTTEFTVMGTKRRAFEPPAARLRRLTAEVAEFKTWMEGLADTPALISADDQQCVLQELTALETTLATLPKLEERRATGNRAILSQLMQQLDRREDSAKPGAIAYDLYYTPKASAVDDRVAALEARIIALETSVGTPVAPFQNVTAGITALEEQLETLNEDKLDRVSKRLQTVNEELTAVLKFKEDAHLTADAKVAELYQLCHQWEAAAPALPHLLERLRILKVVHDESAAFAARLAALEQQQIELRAMLTQCTEAMASLRRFMLENIETMRTNMEYLEAKHGK